MQSPDQLPVMSILQITETTTDLTVRISDQNNAKGTGPTSVFGFLTEPFFLCLKTAAEKNSIEDQDGPAFEQNVTLLVWKSPRA